jgi:dTDP-4-amino-4,6-dideoxygalactose transaminase
MRVALLDLDEQYRSLESEIRAQIEEVLASQRFILGPNGATFEKAVATYCGAPHAIGVSSGTDALLAVLMALEIGPGDAVITSTYSFFATAGCIARVGATPIFVDIDPVTFNLSPAALESYIDKRCQRDASGKLRYENGPRIRAIIPVHLFGLCCDMDPIHIISEKYNLDVIEDAAQAIGAEYLTAHMGLRKAGTMGRSRLLQFLSVQKSRCRWRCWPNRLPR